MTHRPVLRSAAILAIFGILTMLPAVNSAAGLPAPASWPQGTPAPQGLAGHWAGTIEVPGTKLAFDCDFAFEDGAWTGDITIPAQNAKDLPLAGIAVDGAKVAFAIQGVPGEPTFRGEFSADGTKVTGTMSQSGGSFPFGMTREADPAAKAAAALEGFDAVVEQGLQGLHVPGIALAVVRGGKLAYAKGFGVKDAAGKQPVTPDTIFAIGSASKAFTVFALGKQVEEGRMEWDVPVRTYIPWFRLHDQEAGQRLTPRDLVTHRSGVPRHDLVWYNNREIDREGLVRRLAFLPPSAGLREVWQYNNLMFLTAGYLLETLTGKRWEDAVRSLVFEPLDMKTANFSVADSQRAADYALPCAWEEKAFKSIPFRDITTVGPAGSINASVREMANWVMVHLNGGKFRDAQLLNALTIADMHAPKMPLAAASTTPEILASSYGMGWFTDVYRGRRRVHHGGNIDGFSALVAFFPQDDLGFVALSNMNGTALPELVIRTAADRILGLEAKDWIGEAAKRLLAGEESGRKAKERKDTRKVPNTKPAHEIEAYAGVYHHPGYGELRVSLEKQRLTMVYNGIATPLEHWHYETFSGVKSADPTFEDFKLTFRTDPNGRVAELEAIFEPAIGAAVFRKRPDAKYSDPGFLKAFAGTYSLEGQSLTIRLKGDTLTLSIPGQPESALVPDLDGEFVLSRAKTVSVRFLTDPAGNVAAVELIQPNGIFEAKRVKS